MARKKIKLGWIDNNSARRASLKKRRLGLVKKVMELSTLCGIEACLLIYSLEENEPVVWPSHEEVERQLAKLSLIPEVERSRKSVNLEAYNNDRLCKSRDQLMKLKGKSKEVEVRDLMLQVHEGRLLVELNVNELEGLIWFNETKMKDIRNHIDYYKQIPFVSNTSSHGDVPYIPSPQVPLGHDIGISNTGIIRDDERVAIEPFLWDDWFREVTNTNESRGGARSYNSYDSSVIQNLGMQRPSFGGAGSSSVIQNLGMPRPSFGGAGNSSVTPNPGMPRPSYNSGNSNIAPDFGMLGYSFRGRSSVVLEPGASRPLFVGGGSLSGVAADQQLQGPSFGGNSSAMGLPPFDTFIDPTIDMGLSEGENFGPFGGQDMGPGHYPFGPLGRDSPRREAGGNHFGFFGRESSSSGVMGPYVDRNLPNNP